MARLGTWHWAQQSGGVITDRDRAEMDRRVGGVIEAAMLPTPDRTLDLDIADVTPPDSVLCRDASALWRDVAPDWLHGHGHRTWFYARALARLDDLDVDHELLYVACLLHDLGLTDHAPPTPQVPCFAVSGGHAAHRTVEPHRGTTDADLVAEAIAMHLNLDIGADEGALHHLVAAGTLVDVNGARLQLLPDAYVAVVLRRHPRGSFGPDVGDALATVGEAFPDTRCGYLHHDLGIADSTRRHPHDQ